MTEIKLPKRPRPIRKGVDGTGDQPGRNKPELGTWLRDWLLPPRGYIIDPMCGSGQMWLDVVPDTAILGCELVAHRVALAKQNRVTAFEGDAEEWQPPILAPRNGGNPFAVIFSLPFPQSNKDSGKTERQIERVKRMKLAATQNVGPMPNMHRVLTNICSWASDIPVAIICKNYVRGDKTAQVEVNWTGELADMMTMLGMGPVEWFFYRVPPGPFEQPKIKKNPRHRWIDREIVLIGRTPKEVVP